MTPASSGLRDYEAWLDQLDKKLRIAGQHLLIEFDQPLAVPLEDCRSEEQIERWAHAVREIVRGNSTHLPSKYLMQRYVRLVSEHHKLQFDRDKFVEKLMQKWGEF